MKTPPREHPNQAKREEPAPGAATPGRRPYRIQRHDGPEVPHPDGETVLQRGRTPEFYLRPLTADMVNGTHTQPQLVGHRQPRSHTMENVLQRKETQSRRMTHSAPAKIMPDEHSETNQDTTGDQHDAEQSKRSRKLQEARKRREADTYQHQTHSRKRYITVDEAEPSPPHQTEDRQKTHTLDTETIAIPGFFGQGRVRHRRGCEHPEATVNNTWNATHDRTRHLHQLQAKSHGHGSIKKDIPRDNPQKTKDTCTSRMAIHITRRSPHNAVHLPTTTPWKHRDRHRLEETYTTRRMRRRSFHHPTHGTR